MTAITFDTLKYVEALKAAGITEEQAKAQAEALKEVQASQLQELATKADVEGVKLELRHEMTTLKVEIIKWMIGLLMGQTALLIAAVKILT
ncbi:MAG: DUF1640 domain-containing protein [Magnetococcales bacterium]|nr:DUF1640 domain-containing protein [Magnetococcales bacterium]